MSVVDKFQYCPQAPASWPLQVACSWACWHGSPCPQLWLQCSRHWGSWHLRWQKFFLWRQRRHFSLLHAWANEVASLTFWVFPHSVLVSTPALAGYPLVPRPGSPSQASSWWFWPHLSPLPTYNWTCTVMQVSELLGGLRASWPCPTWSWFCSSIPRLLTYLIDVVCIVPVDCEPGFDILRTWFTQSSSCTIQEGKTSGNPPWKIFYVQYEQSCRSVSSCWLQLGHVTWA